jgi:hypothetical protein
MTLTEINSLESRVSSAIDQLESIKHELVAKRHILQGPRRAGLYPGQLDNYVEEESDDCYT